VAATIDRNEVTSVRSRFAWLGGIAAAMWIVASCVSAQTVKIWPRIAPGSEHWTYHAKTVKGPNGAQVIDVSTPTITAFLPPRDKATGTGVIVAPGGAFIALEIDLEGREVARWLQVHGIAAFLLQYRLMQPPPGGGFPSMRAMDAASKLAIADGIQAMKAVREHAKQWGVDPHRIGIVGFSAGGTVATGVMMSGDASARPDFVGDIYGGPFGGLKTVPAGLPPVFLAWAQDDQIGTHTALKVFVDLSAHGYTPEAHAFYAGHHAFGMKKQGTTSDHWIDEFYWWLQARGLTRRG